MSTLSAGRVDLAGQVIGRLYVIEPGDKRGGRTTWRCRCACGAFTTVKTEHLRGGTVKSCGCLGAERRSGGNPKHGGKRTRLYRIWCCIKTRCLNPASEDYPNYGGRGITLCERWVSDFAAFRADVGEPPGLRMTLDRIDNDKNYEPGNVRWASKAEQARNQRTNRMETLHGVTQSLADWADDLGIPYGVLLHRLHRGATFAEAVATGWDLKPGRSRRVRAALAAVETIPTEALEAGALGVALNEFVDLMQEIDTTDAAPDSPNGIALAALRALGRLP